MSSATIICIAALTLFCALLAWAAVSDFRRFLIPNQASLGALALYPVFVLSAPFAVQWHWALAIAAGFFAIGFALYAVGAMGAGDAKLLPVVILWAGPSQVALFILVLAGSTVVLAAVLAVRAAFESARGGTDAAGGAAAVAGSGIGRVFRALTEFGYVRFLRIKLPYGVAIAAGGIAVAVNMIFTMVR